MANSITTTASRARAALSGDFSESCAVPKFIPDEFQRIKVITMKPRGINHALLVTLVYLVIYTHRFLQGLEEDAESLELNVAENRGTREKRTTSQPQLGWVQTALGSPEPHGHASLVEKPRQQRHATWRVAGAGHTGIRAYGLFCDLSYWGLGAQEGRVPSLTSQLA